MARHSPPAPRLDAHVETDLFRRWRNGDRRAGDRLVRSYTPMLHAYFRRRFDGDVGDLVQRTWLALTEAKGRFRFECEFRPFCLATARNIGYEEIRRRVRPLPTQEVARMVMGPSFDPAEVLAQLEWEAALDRATATLDAVSLRLLRSYYWDDRSGPALARDAGIAEPTIRSRLRRAKERLARHLGSSTGPRP